MEEQIKILSCYGIKSKIKLFNAHGGFNNNWKVVSTQGEFILKQRPVKFFQRSVIEYKLSLYLKNKILTAIPVKSIHGKYLLKTGKYVYSLFGFIRGQKYIDNNVNLKIIAKSMANFHLATKGFSYKTFLNLTVEDYFQTLINQYSDINKKNI